MKESYQQNNEIKNCFVFLPKVITQKIDNRWSRSQVWGVLAIARIMDVGCVKVLQRNASANASMKVILARHYRFYGRGRSSLIPDANLLT